MKVLFINCISDRSEVNLYLGLKAKGVDLELILDPQDPAISLLQEAGCKVSAFKIKSRFDLSFDRFLKEKIQTEKYDIIHAPTSRGISSAIRTAKKTNIKLITYRGTLGHLSRWSLLARLAHLNRRVDAILCNCLAVKEYLIKQKIPASKLPVIYKGHDFKWYQSTEIYKREDFNIADSAFVVGCIANLRPLKGIDVLLKALSYLHIEQPVVCLLIGENRISNLEKLISKLGLTKQVKLLGFRKDVSKILPLCDVTVMPSVKREGFPRAIVESMSLKVPVICSNVGGMPEIIEDQINGLVVPAGNVLALTKALTKFSNDPDFRKTAGDRCFEIMTSKLSLEQYIENTLKVYEGFLDRRL